VSSLADQSVVAASFASPPDPHSFSNPDQVEAKHLDLELNVDFGAKVLTGVATWTIERRPKAPEPATLVLDTRAITVDGVEEQAGNGEKPEDFRPARFDLGKDQPIFGAALRITLRPETTRVWIRYHTSPEAGGLQWLDPAGTAGKIAPFLFSQSEAIHARSWVPIQDSPGVRITYNATVRVPKGLVAVMAADTPRGQTKADEDGAFRFSIKQPIPSYLMALAVGDLAFKSLGPRTGVVAEPSVLAAAAQEFADVERMIDTVEKRFGPYRWGRYDILVLPPSFPFGGMENPKLTFATPTILAGDRSLVSLIAHELAHSWSGNLVTNATWRDFWLNEGFTSYLEGRITEEVYGKERADMDEVLAFTKLQADMKKIPSKDQVLHIDLAGRDPDDGMSSIPYDKGALFIRTLEETFGRERFDRFLHAYFDHFAFRSITTADFETFLKENLFDKEPKLAERIDLKEWIHEPGLPADHSIPRSEELEAIDRIATGWVEKKLSTDDLGADTWSTQEWVCFLESMPNLLAADRMSELDRRYKLTGKRNAEILNRWLVLAIRNHYRAADEKLENVLTTVGRRKFLIPLYTELKNIPGGLERAKAIFAKAKAGYHPIAAESIGKLLGP
jgi:aminopeptidase N